MTDNREIVNTFLNAFQKGDTNRLGTVLADNYTFTHDGLPQKNGKKEFLGMVTMLKTAFPDWRFENINFVSDRNPIKVKVDTQGTHKGTLDLTPLGMGKIPPTNKSFKNTQEPISFVVENGKVTKHSVDSRENGITGALQKLGIAPEKTT